MWVVRFKPWPLYPRERTPLTIEYEAGWAAEAVWGFGGRENDFFWLRNFVVLLSPYRKVPECYLKSGTIFSNLLFIKNTTVWCYLLCATDMRSLGSSVTIVTRLRAGRPRNCDSITGGLRDFPPVHIQTCPGPNHPNRYRRCFTLGRNYFGL
jgi:hypothetical protein